mgnify:CR=1 FL=1
MSKAPPSLSRRISLAFGSFFGILSRPDFAADVDRLRTGGASEAPTSLPQPAAPSAAPAPAPVPAVMSAPAAAPVPPVVPATPKEADTAAALLEVAGQVAGFSNQLAESGKATAKELADLSGKLTASEKAFTDLKAAHDKLTTDFTALQAKLDADPTGSSQRDPATGGDGNAVVGY